MPYFRKAIEKMSGYTPGEQINRDVIKLNTNENPYPPSPRVIKALKEHAGDTLRLYPDPLSQELLEKASEQYGFPVSSILAGNGSDDLLTMIFRTFLDPGSAVTTFEPTYTLYETLADIQDARVNYVDLTDTFDIPEDFSDTDARAVILANPNSPSGTLISAERVKEIAQKISGVIVIDEAYADFARDNCLDLARSLENVIVLRSFSKSFSLAGVRLGLGFAHPSIIEQMAKVKDSYNVDRLAIKAGVAALEDYAWMEQNCKKIIRTRERLIQQLSELGLEPVRSESNFVYVKCPGASASKLYELLKKENILVRYFDREKTRDYLRITVGTDDQIDTLIKTVNNILIPLRQETQ